MSDWKYIDEYESLPDAEFIHCDTRDFHILCVDDNQAETLKNIRNVAGYGTLSDCKFTKEEILKVLKDLETRSGGKGRWRLISTESHPTWLKYIRFIKIDEDGESVYIAYSNMGDQYEVLSHKLLSEPIDKELLAHH